MNRDINKFKEYGYIVITDFLTEEELVELNDECDRLSKYAMNGDKKDGWVYHRKGNPIKLDGAMKVSDKFYRLGRNKKLVDHAKKILQSDNIDTYISKFFPMIPREGFSVEWHQDNFYIDANPNNMISCDVFVNGTDKENGCLRILPNSHHKNFPHTKSSHNVFTWIEEGLWDNVIDIELDEPFAVIFHPLLVHSCYRNTSDRFRYSVAWEYIDRTNISRRHRGHFSQDRLKIT